MLERTKKGGGKREGRISLGKDYWMYFFIHIMNIYADCMINNEIDYMLKCI